MIVKSNFSKIVLVKYLITFVGVETELTNLK